MLNKIIRYSITHKIGDWFTHIGVTIVVIYYFKTTSVMLFRYYNQVQVRYKFITCRTRVERLITFPIELATIPQIDEIRFQVWFICSYYCFFWRKYVDVYW
jgi:Cu/Ag efflux pump CusA